MGLPANMIMFEKAPSVNPQKENGYVPIANEIMDALCKAYIPARERQCLDFIIRKTYGFGKKTDDISLSQFEKGTGLQRRNIREYLSSLVEKNIIGMLPNQHTQDGKTQHKPSTYWFNKKYTEWKAEPTQKRGMPDNEHTLCRTDGKRVCRTASTTKDNITKDNSTKDNNLSRQVADGPNLDTYKISHPELFKFVEAFVLFMISEKKNKAPKKTDSLIRNSIDTVEKLIRIDEFSLDYIRDVSRWAVKNDFYSTNFFSLAPLRKKSRNGATKFANMASKYDAEKNEKQRSEKKWDL